MHMNSTSHLFTYIQTTLPTQDMWSDVMMSIWVPVATYWAYGTLFHFKRNRVSLSRVVTMVIIQQMVQMLVGIIVMIQPVDPARVVVTQEAAISRLADTITAVTLRYGFLKSLRPVAEPIAQCVYCVLRPLIQFLSAMFIMDTYQYFLHRFFHQNKFCYRHFHSHHHKLYVPYAFGALYNHPVEGFLLDTVGGALAFELTGMSHFLSMLFFIVSTIKTVDDHCGYSFPWDPLQVLFGNNVAYHNIHHQPYGIKKNFSQPYFTFWDRLLGTMY